MSFNEWRSYKISEVGKVITGKTPPTKDPDNFNGEFPFITPVDMNGQKYVRNTARSLSKKGQGILKNFTLPKDAICISCIGSDLGKVVKTSTLSFTNQQINSIVCNEMFDSDFIYYALHNISPLIRSIGRNSTAVPIINKSDFSEFEILAPKDLNDQKQIGAILSSLDDKIENNLATNQTLEEIAQTLFKEWFVNFNYPNADGNIKHSEFGEIPESWEIGTLGDIYKTTSGGTPSRSKVEYYENGTIGWVKSKELNNSFIIDTEEKITEDALKNSSAKLFPKHSVLIAMYGATVGEIGITTNEFTCNQAICSFLPNENYPFSFIYNFLLHSKQDIIGRAVGSAQQNISQQVLLQFKLVIPPSELVQEYHRIVFPLFQKIQDNIEENERLRDLRDSLLPKLMSGEIDLNVSNI
jgi:type I restriction enzyme S subunit